MTGEAVISSKLTCKTQLLQILPDLCMGVVVPVVPRVCELPGIPLHRCCPDGGPSWGGRATRQPWLTHQNTLTPAGPLDRTSCEPPVSLRFSPGGQFYPAGVNNMPGEVTIQDLSE